MSSKLAHASHPPGIARDPASAASTAVATTLTLHLRDEQARNASRHIPAWLDEVRDAGANEVSIDMSDVHRLDFSGFGVLLAKLRDVLRVRVRLASVGVSEAVSLRSMGVLDDIAVEQRSEGRGHQTHSSGPRDPRQPDRVRTIAPGRQSPPRPHSTGLNSEPVQGRLLRRELVHDR